jgi:F-type H+-transporting ATPase subunit epsilon
MADSITLRVITPEKIVLDTVASAVVVPGVDGEIGILPRHAPMVAALGPGPLSYTSGGVRESLFVAGGFAEVRQNTLRVVTEASERPSEIDVDRAQRAAERARERLRTKVHAAEELDSLRAELALRRAMMRQKTVQRGR